MRATAKDTKIYAHEKPCAPTLPKRLRFEDDDAIDNVLTVVSQAAALLPQR